MRDEEVITLIRQRLPELVRTDPEIRGWILDLGREYFADRVQTDARFERMLAELRQEREDWNRRYLLQRIDTGFSAIGARWGIFAESAFRNGIQAILEESFGVQVLHYQGYDETGDVFGHPDQVELDLIIRDSTLIVCAIKSSMSRSDMYTFDRKVRFYERREGRQADRKIVISPMVEEKAFQIARRLGIEVYTHADEVRFQEVG